MRTLSHLSPIPFWVKTAGFLLAKYLHFVEKTTRFTPIPMDLRAHCLSHEPAIIAMWHGQHFMIPFLKAFEPQTPVSALVSRNKDGAAAAIVVESFGIIPIRGSGGRGTYNPKRGGASSLKALIRALNSGSFVALTADPPKRPRHCGLGIVTLARMSGRPILPTAVVCGRSLTFPSWDRASIGLPFGKGAIVVGDPIHVPEALTPEEEEFYRSAVENGLNDVHKQAYGLVDSHDPGAYLKAGISKI